MIIIDAHAHIFSKIGGRRGSESTFAGKYGKIISGNQSFQVLPPFFLDSTFNVEILVSMMDYAGVDKAVLVQNPMYGIVNEEIKQAISKYSDRLIGTIQVDPFDENAIDIIKKTATPKQSAIKFEISQDWGWSGIYQGLKINSPEFIRIWDLASEMGLHFIIDTGRINNSGYQIDAFDYISNKYPTVKILLEHLGYMTTEFIENEKAKNRRLELLSLAHKGNIYLGFSATNILIDDDYPCISSIELLKEAVALVGVDKILWGSDIPSTLGKYTYRQMIDVVLKHAYFLTENDKQKILGLNAMSFFEYLDNDN